MNTMQVGDAFTHRHVLSQKEFDRFARLSGDDNPIHVEPAFAARTRFGKTVAHGMYLYSLICGVLTRHFPDFAPLAQDLMFPAPSFVGEEIAIQVRVRQVAAGMARVETVITRPNGEIGCQGEATLQHVDAGSL